MTEYHKLSGLKNRNFKSKIRVSAWLGSVERPLLAGRCHLLSVSSHRAVRGWGRREGRQGGKEGEGRFLSLLIRPQSYDIRAPPYDFIYS